MTQHLCIGGVLIVEPWLYVGDWQVPHQIAESANAPGVAVSRVSTNGLVGHISSFTWHWTVAFNGEVETFVEEHRMGLYTIDDYRVAMHAAGLDDVEHDPVGPVGRGAFVGTRSFHTPQSALRNSAQPNP